MISFDFMFSSFLSSVRTKVLPQFVEAPAGLVVFSPIGLSCTEQGINPRADWFFPLSQPATHSYSYLLPKGTQSAKIRA